MKTQSLAILMLLGLTAGLVPNGYTQGVSMANPQMAHQSLPTLKYNPPPNFFKLSSCACDDYSSTEVNAAIQIYQFRPFTGNIQAELQRTLLRDWIDPLYREENVGARPVFKNVTLEGAQAVIIARFVENIAGLPKEHMRTVIVANGAAAIIDVSAGTEYSWQRITPAVGTLFESVSIEAGATMPASPARISAAGRTMAGIYMGYKPKFTVNLFGPVGTGTFPPSPHFYLLSPDGRAYRTFDILKVPKSDPSRFDYAAAARTDPENSGQFSVQCNQLVMRFGAADTVTATMVSRDVFTIYGVTYARQ